MQYHSPPTCLRAYVPMCLRFSARPPKEFPPHHFIASPLRRFAIASLHHCVASPLRRITIASLHHCVASPFSSLHHFHRFSFSFVRSSPIPPVRSSILLVFGNKDGLEELLLMEDAQRKGKTYTGVEKNKVLKKILRKFDLFLNTCPHQTSRTIRTEEAITMTLSLFHDMLM
ncbi:RNA methyltransferase, putative [Plasmodium ovale wallikeri]|uniref:RNA methyltransferase, putative n=1 Tax=Plasmodium ovale wallikeri TaxID=864142 RepID=A0A1A8YG00_PLAOA|nr:RNA methyltransferase, putative [Plasmodium ovale wallikeri]SBT45511.1 RNA methyltransferase, putative [Plasmodium ovale wallikeri]